MFEIGKPIPSLTEGEEVCIGENGVFKKYLIKNIYEDYRTNIKTLIIKLEKVIQ